MIKNILSYTISWICWNNDKTQINTVLTVFVSMR